MQFQPSDSLRTRTFIGLILSQFLAAFNDQAIHAAGMFYAIRRGTLTEGAAITLMPILFYLPWAIFPTLAGYLADRYSKRNSLVFWKVAEVGITLVAWLGFWLGTAQNLWVGPWVVLSTVFLMGMHSAFFVPAKYGCMPEILQPAALSRGNGVLESTSFLAIILGTVTGGILSSLLKDQEYFIGAVLTGLAVLGAGFSVMIERMPAANPARPFPTNPVRPLAENLRTLLRSRPLALAVLGIAFFTFVVAFMRATMYMHGESQNPRWSEFETSLIVATVALGVGLGSPLAGVLSGGKVELGLVPLGAVGMIVLSLAGAVVIFDVPALIVCLILLGFSSGFYIVPLYTLLQHRAPKQSKGDLIATNNFICVLGAIASSILFWVLIRASQLVGIAHPIPQLQAVLRDGHVVTTAEPRAGDRPEAVLDRVEPRSSKHPVYARLRYGPVDHGVMLSLGRQPTGEPPLGADSLFEEKPEKRHKTLLSIERGVGPGDPVEVSSYQLRGTSYFEIRAEGRPLHDAYDRELVPRYLFVGASLMTLMTLILLCHQLPDFFVRALLWLRLGHGGRLKVIGVHNLPTNGGCILATNCDEFRSAMRVIGATDRFTRFVLLEAVPDLGGTPVLSYLARRTGLMTLPTGPAGETAVPAGTGPVPPSRDPERILKKAIRTLNQGHLLGVTVMSDTVGAAAEAFFARLHAGSPAVVVPVFCGAVRRAGESGAAGTPEPRIVIGHPLPAGAGVALVRQAIRELGDWIVGLERQGKVPTTKLIPGPATAVSAEAAADTA